MIRLKYHLNDVNLFDKANWDRMGHFLIEYLPKSETAINTIIKNLN
jgi:hypothetical protein